MKERTKENWFGCFSHLHSSSTTGEYEIFLRRPRIAEKTRLQQGRYTYEPTNEHQRKTHYPKWQLVILPQS